LIVDDILNIYEETHSMRRTAKETGCSWQRVVKILSSNDIVINEAHGMILKLYEAGNTPKEIASQIGYSEKVVKAYLPKKRPYYGVNLSENAKRIKRCRENREERVKGQ